MNITDFKELSELTEARKGAQSELDQLKVEFEKLKGSKQPISWNLVDKLTVIRENAMKQIIAAEKIINQLDVSSFNDKSIKAKALANIGMIKDYLTKMRYAVVTNESDFDRFSKDIQKLLNKTEEISNAITGSIRKEEKATPNPQNQINQLQQKQKEIENEQQRTIKQQAEEKRQQDLLKQQLDQQQRTINQQKQMTTIQRIQPITIKPTIISPQKIGQQISTKTTIVPRQTISPKATIISPRKIQPITIIKPLVLK